jgi:hypothetical protein
MTRITDVNSFFTGQEPKFSIELTKTDLVKTLAWYAQNKDKNDAFKYACEYFEKKLKIDASFVLKSKLATFGFICRILLNGGSLPIKNMIWFNTEIENIKKELTKKPVDVSPVIKTNVINIQDRIREKASECIGELEGQIDNFILSDFKVNVAPYTIFHTMNIKDAQTKFILEWAKRKRTEFDEALNTNDKQIKEGWSNFTKSQIKKLIDYCDKIILDCQKVSGESIQSRKPRKRTVKSPDQLTAKMKYMTEFKELNLTSIKVTDIIGSMMLWVYNTKTRKLGVYHANDAGGLSVKGCGILNFSEIKSIQKKLRKPEQMLPDMLSGGKVFLKNVMDNIRAVDGKLNGRINCDTILLRVIK